jgi:hypothetical protein
MKLRPDPLAFNPEKVLKKDAAKSPSGLGRLPLVELMPIRWSKTFTADFIARLTKTTPAVFQVETNPAGSPAALKALEAEVAGELKKLGIAEDSKLIRMLAWGCLADPHYRRAIRRLKPSV